MEYRSIVVAFMRAPMNEAALARMEEILESIKSTVTSRYDASRHFFAHDDNLLRQFEDDYKTALHRCTLERTVNVCVEEFVVKNFNKYGIGAYGDVVRHGWEEFDVGPEDEIRLAWLVSGSFLT